MAERSAPLPVLQNLLERARQLANKPRMSAEFAEWHRELIEAAEQIFGSGSKEAKELKGLQFEPNPELVDRGADVLATSGREIGVSREAIEFALEKAQQEYYRKRVHEAAEIITGMILATSGKR